MLSLDAHRHELEACRFCPMCKPAGEVANLVANEAYSTRARALLLWQLVAGRAEWTPRHAELLYQSTLDSIAQAWCVGGISVPDYVLAGRAEAWSRGLVPPGVRLAVESTREVVVQGGGDVILLAGEAAGQSDQSFVEVLARLLGPVTTVVADTGAVAYTMGAADIAREKATRIADMITEFRPRKVIADGPETMWALRSVYPALGVDLGKNVQLTTATAVLNQRLTEGQLVGLADRSESVLIHDARAATFLADESARPEAIHPGYAGPEEGLGAGSIFEAPREVAKRVGLQPLFHRWSRSLSRSCGADDGLWQTYPALAESLALRVLEEAARLGATTIVADSPLCAGHLRRVVGGRDVEGGSVRVTWLAELVQVSP